MAALLALSGCGKPLCSTEVQQVARDLGSDRYAVTEVRNCGATTDYVTIVRVGRANEPQADAKEVFVADSDHGQATMGNGGAVWMNVVWTGPGKLVIGHASRARIVKQASNAEGATIVYRPGEPIGLPTVP